MFSFQIRYAAGRTLLIWALCLVVVMNMQGTALPAETKQIKQISFASPEAAVDALLQSLRNHDEKELFSLFGANSEWLISTGDPVDDRERREKFIRLYEEKHSVEKISDKKVIIHLGNIEWPFAIPVVKVGQRWRWDTQQGKEEITNRRIGENELATIQTCLAVVDAQQEYAAVDRDGDGLREFAQKFYSTKGKKDGLFWETVLGEEESPLGPLLAKARSEGYEKGDEPIPYNGYYFRILTSQGKRANGGAYSYLVNGKLLGGFAVVAYPATYAVTGVKSFIVNHQGVVYQKDLGLNTTKLAKSMKTFNPDKTWKKVEQGE